MSLSWQGLNKRLLELQKNAPKPLVIELTYKDDTREILSLNEVLERDNFDFRTFRVVEGGRKKDIKQFLDWLAPDCFSNEGRKK